MSKNQILHLVCAGIFRLLIIHSNYSLFFKNRVEFSTPLNSFKRVQEGIYLYDNGINPYSGDMVHEGPIVLLTFSWILKNYSFLLPFIYIFADLLTALLLLKSVRNFLKENLSQENEEKKFYAADTEDFQLNHNDIPKLSEYVFLIYLWNPFIWASCSAYATTVFNNLFLAFFLYFLSKKQELLCLSFLALESVRNMYPFVLITPVILIFYKFNTFKVVLIITKFLSLCGLVLWINYKIMNSWDFLDSTLGFIFFNRDLQPNIGLFWYFFTEMFDHFRIMFLVTLQMNATILYLIPLTIKMRKDPFMLAILLITLITIFKSYPCLGDTGFYLSLLPACQKCWKFMAHNFVVFCIFLITLFIMPTFWHLWIMSGSANANFYFGVTLGFSSGQIFLVTDLLCAYTKREFFLKNGKKILINGKPGKIALE